MIVHLLSGTFHRLHACVWYINKNLGNESHLLIQVGTESCAQIHINWNLLKMNNWMMQYLSKH